MRPFLPSAATRTASSAASSGACGDGGEKLAFERGEIGHLAFPVQIPMRTLYEKADAAD